MKFYEARARADNKNKLAKGVREINKLIEAAADTGRYSLDVEICYDWGSPSSLAEYYNKNGFKATHYSKQVSPNDSDYFIHLKWE